MSFCPNSLEKLAETMRPSDYVNLSKWIRKSIVLARSSDTPFALEYSDCGYDRSVRGDLNDLDQDEQNREPIIVEGYSQEDNGETVWDEEVLTFLINFFN